MPDFLVMTYAWAQASCIPSLPRRVKAETALDAAQSLTPASLDIRWFRSSLLHAKAWRLDAPQEVQFFYADKKTLPDFL